MKLSEAMRLGAMLKPQAQRLTRSHDGGTCALGAALDAISVTDGVGWFPVYEHFPIASVKVAYPGVNWRPPGSGTVMVASACWILNDCDGWTRERIADWVEGIERAQDQPLAVSEVLRPVSIATAPSSAQK